MHLEEILLLILFMQILMEIYLILLMEKKILENGKINFIGDAETRIKEDYLRVLRYIRFFLNYSKNKHDPKVLKIIKKNLTGFQIFLLKDY